MVCDPYLAGHENYGRVCVYDVESATLLLEIRSLTACLKEPGLGFAFEGQRIAFCVPESVLRIHDAANGNLLYEHRQDSTATCSAFHPLFGLYAVGSPSGVTVLIEDGEPTEGRDVYARHAARAAALTERFIAANEKNLWAVGEYADDA